MEVFEKILLNYGGYILICVRNVFQANEAYEECAEINKVLQNHGVSTTMTMEDWETEMWRNGTSGIIAMKNAPCYFLEALEMCKQKGLLDKFINITMDKMYVDRS